MKKLLFSLLLLSGIANGQDMSKQYPSVLVDLRNDPDAIELQINDLQQQQVNLGFDFPLYDQTFSDVWVTYTGVLNFQETTNGGSFCCNGMDMDDPQFQQQAANGGYQHLNYSILAMWTDLHVEYNANPWYKTNSSNATFGWYDIPEFGGTTNLNSFEVKIFDSGDIKFRYDEVNIQNHAVTVGVTGNLELGDYAQFKFRTLADGWQSDVPKVWTFNTLTGVFEDQYGDLTNFGAYVPPVFEDPCDTDPDSCGIFDPVSSFNSEFDIPGDSIYDFIPDTIFYTPDTYTDQDQFNNDYAAMTQMADDFGIDEYYDSLPDFDAQQDEFNQQFEEQGYVEPTGGYEEPIDFIGDTEEFFEENFQMESFDDIPGDFEDFQIASAGMEEEFIETFEELAEDIIDVVLEEDIFEEEFVEDDIFEEEFVEVALTEELFDEEITHEEVVMSKKDENLHMSDDNVDAIDVLKTTPTSESTTTQLNAARRIDAVSIAVDQIQSSADLVETAIVSSTSFATNSAFSTSSVDTIETQETLSQEIETQETLLEEIATQETLLEEIATQELSEFGGIAEITEESIIEELLDQNSGSDSGGGMDFSMGDLGDTGQTFSDGQSAFGDDTSFDFSFGGPSVVFAATTIESTTQQSDTQEVVDTSSSTTTTVDQNFDSQTDQAFSSGGSISDALTATAPPDFSRFNVAPPSQQEQQTTQKADAQANNMSEEQLEQNLDEFASNMQDSGGFTDQSLTVFLMGRNSGFSQYAGQLQDVSFYTDRGMPGGKMSNDRNSMLQLIGTNGKHEEMIAEQYK
jgi:hypothetical protein